MAFNFMGNVKTLTSSVTSLKKELSGVYDVLKKIKGLGPSAFGDVNAVLSKSGQFGNGQGTPVFGKTSVNGAPKFSSQTKMGAAQPSSNAQLSNYEKTAAAMQTQYLNMGIRQAKFGVASGAASVVTSVVGGVANMLPSVGDVAKRAGTFYTASAMFGGTNRTQNQLSTMAAMRGGITGPMGTAEAFGTLTNYSFMPGSSNMAMGLGQVGAAAKALNMDNATAANAVGALSTGSMGAQLYQYGIRQYDDKGNLRTPGAIAKDLMQRVFYTGKDVTKIGAEQFAKDSMGMNLDYQLSTMGITGETATIIKASMGQIASGKSGELKDFNTSDNPLNSFYKINQSEESLTQDSEKALLKGAETAADALVKLNKALENTPELILQMKGALETFNGTKSGNGVSGLVKGVFGGVTSMLAGAQVMKYLKNIKAGGAPAGKVVADTAAKTAARTAATTAAAEATTIAGTTAASTAGLAAVPVTAGAALLYGQYQYDKQGKENLAALERTHYQATHGGKNPDGTTTDISGGPNAEMRAFKDERPWWKKVGSWFNRGLSGMDSSATGVQGGPTSGFFSLAGGSSSGVNSFTFSSGSQPMANGTLAASMSSTSLSKVISAGFGAKDAGLTMAGALNYHTGEDTPMAVGTPVYARFAGKVVERNLSRDLGIAVEVDHGDGYSSIYGHLNLKSVRSGQEVKVGDLIGKSGSTGRVRGPHLHFELRKGKVPTDPKGYDPFVPKDKTGNKQSTSSSAAGAAVSPANVSAGVRASGKELHTWLMSLGLSSNGATGVLGNLIQESGLKTNNPGDNGTSNGIAQWHDTSPGKGRLTNLMKFAKSKNLDPYSLEAQKLFLWKEMQNYPGMLKSLQDPNIGIVDAAALFMRKFERPKDDSDKAAAKRASLGIGALQGGPTDGFNTNVNTATLGTDMAVRNPGVATSLQGQTNNIYVTLQIQQANQQEAEAFAKTLKKYLEKDNKLQKIGSN